MSQNLLFYSIRISVVLKFFGYLCIAVGFTAIIPLIASMIFQEWHVTIYYLSVSLFSLIFGKGLTKIRAQLPIQMNESIAIVCLSYLYAVLFSSIPLSAGGLDWFDAIFEATSGITTTGMTMITDWKVTPKTTMFARSWLQWIGGLSIMLFSLVYLFQQGEITKKFSMVEKMPDDPIGGSKAYARNIVLVYTLITLGGMTVMFLLGTPIYDTFLFVLSSVSTGGFPNKLDSFASLSRLQQSTMMFMAFLCASPLFLYYKLWSRGFKRSLEGFQFIVLLVLCILVSIALGSSVDDWLLGFSAQTTTGFSTMDLDSLSNQNKLLLIFSMLIGAGIGSTGGGFKVLRLMLFFLYLKNFIIRQGKSKHAFYKPKLFGIPISDVQLENALSLICIYVFITMMSWFSFISMGYAPLNSLFEVASALGTTGLSTGITDVDLPLFLKLVLCLDMLLGRIEILPWIVLLYPKTWIGTKLEVS